MMPRLRTPLVTLTLLLICVLVRSQAGLEQWHHLDASEGFPTGIGTADWYKSMDSKAKTKVVVAIVDSGIDIDHPDLKDQLWVNRDELAGNQKDDDQNGYVDDLHGWNFIGGPGGESVVLESYEVTRLYAQEKVKWNTIDTTRLSGKEKKAFAEYKDMRKTVETKRSNAMLKLREIEQTADIVMSALEAAQHYLGTDSLNVKKLEKSKDEHVLLAVEIIRNIEEQGVQVESLDWLIQIAEEQFAEEAEHYAADLEFHYNPDYDSRKIVGDKYEDFDDRIYGNADVDGVFSFHGTHVAGIVGATRGNGLGIDGIADQVELMAIKVVPDGDERDKDVANAIRYAVDNGAQIINMSFGKGYSPEKHLVDDAMRYAQKHDVLLVIGAGNEASDLDQDPKFPNDRLRKKSLFGPRRVKNVLSVGALSPEGGKQSIAEFSNYGKTEVDVLAPGVDIYSAAPGGEYAFASGTSMAAPVVAGVAAVIRSRYPDLSALQVKKIIMGSTRPVKGKVIQPGTFEMVEASEICVTGGMVDVTAAMKQAGTVKGKAKSKNRKFAPLPVEESTAPDKT